MSIAERVNTYKTKYEYGFIKAEIETLLKEYSTKRSDKKYKQEAEQQIECERAPFLFSFILHHHQQIQLLNYSKTT
jgi:hypothetical protein